ncbi:unnamed protein product, partial [marine sediment metagenome]
GQVSSARIDSPARRLKDVLAFFILGGKEKNG